MTAVRAGVVAWQSADTQPSKLAWDDYAVRLARYQLFDAYYENTAYDKLNPLAIAYKKAHNLYTHIRPIYNPCTRLVDLYVSKVYGGNLDTGKLTKGAIPISFAQSADSEKIAAALRRLWQWSNWNTAKNLYVRKGALHGDVFLKVIDDRESGKVRLEVIEASKVKDMQIDAVGNIKAITIEYILKDEATGNEYAYTEKIDGDRFATFKDNTPFSYFNDNEGTPLKEWHNDYGFVPVVAAQHRDIGKMFGLNVFRTSIPKINEINDAASLLNDQLRKTINPLWYFAGVASKEQLKAQTENRDEIPAIYGPAGSEAKPMIANIDAPAALSNIEAMLKELERDMPELALHRLREEGNLTAPGVRAGWSDATDRFVEARGNYDGALTRAMQMAISIGGLRNYKDFEGFSLASYADGALDFSIADRPVIDDELSTKDRIDLLIQSGAPMRAVWSAMGYAEDMIDEWEKEKEQDAAASEARFAAQIDQMARRPDPTQQGGAP